MEELLHHLGCINLVNNGKNYQAQLVSRISAINSTTKKKERLLAPLVLRYLHHHLRHSLDEAKGYQVVDFEAPWTYRKKVSALHWDVHGTLVTGL